MSAWKSVFESTPSGSIRFGLRIEVSDLKITPPVAGILDRLGKNLVAEIQEEFWKTDPQVKLRHREKIINLRRCFDQLGNLFIREIPNELESSAQYPNWVEASTSVGRFKVGYVGNNQLYVDWADILLDLDPVVDPVHGGFVDNESEAKEIIVKVFSIASKNREMLRHLRHLTGIDDILSSVLNNEEGMIRDTIQIPPDGPPSS